MLYYLHLLNEWLSWLRVFRYITVRALAGAVTAFVLSMWLGPRVIRTLHRLRIGQPERTDAEAPGLGTMHGHKAGTPTMGGLLIIGAVVVSALLWTPPTNAHVGLTLLTMLFMGAVGLMDDWRKVRQRHSRGLSARAKLLLQTGWALAVAAVLLGHADTGVLTRQLMVPFLKAPLIPDMGVWLAAAFVALILVGSSNAVNLTDGLDGLAIGCTGSVALAYLAMAYVAGHAKFAEYLMVPHVAGGGELAVFCGCLLGASLGFLWYNCHPAQVFMGDTGSLAIGGSIAMVAVLIKQELVLIIVGGVFVMEAVSVILQVVNFKLRGRRIFAMAPIHHHFRLRRWSETQVTVRFWILSILFALLGLATLKIR